MRPSTGYVLVLLSVLKFGCQVVELCTPVTYLPIFGVVFVAVHVVFVEADLIQP
jgi:hypothetical protein